jgi:PAS domain-containing protein
MDQTTPEQRAMELRQQAEQRLNSGPILKPPPDITMHELQVHQIELEMQNEALRQAQVELEESRDRYVDLYDFAPVGYLTLTQDGLIDAINLTGATLLRVERARLPLHRFDLYVTHQDRERWRGLFLATRERGDCELVLQRGDESVFHARLDLLRISTATRPLLRIALTDISARVEAEEALRAQAKELRSYNAELAYFNKLMIGRELDMMALKQQVNELSLRLGLEPPYPRGNLVDMARLKEIEG